MKTAHALAVVVLAAVATLGSSCSKHQTELILVVTTDGVRIPEDVRKLHLTVTDREPSLDDVVYETDVELCSPELTSSCYNIPVTAVLFPGKTPRHRHRARARRRHRAGRHRHLGRGAVHVRRRREPAPRLRALRQLPRQRRLRRARSGVRPARHLHRSAPRADQWRARSGAAGLERHVDAAAGGHDDGGSRRRRSDDVAARSDVDAGPCRLRQRHLRHGRAVRRRRLPAVR